MNTKTQYLLPAFAAVFALMFVAATPYIMAESDAEKNAWHDGKKDTWKDAKHHKKHMAVNIEGFVGSIPVPEEMNKETYKTIKDQITVSLSEAASGLDVMMGHIGIAINENDEEFVVWSLTSMNMSDESELKTITTHIVDAGDASNTAKVIKEFDYSMKSRYHGDYDSYDRMLSDPEQIENKLKKIEKKLNEGIDNPDLEKLAIENLYLLRQLQIAITGGDTTQADSLREQLIELRNQMIDLKKFK